MTRQNWLSVFVMLLGVSGISAQQKAQPPVLRVEPGGPTSFVTSLVFSSDGKKLYTAGFDKVVRVYRLEKSGKFVLDSTKRIPIGPGPAGIISALALSADDKLLAISGNCLMRGTPRFDEDAWVVSGKGRLTADMRRDQGIIYLADLETGKWRELRGHRGEVVSLAFEQGPKSKNWLVSGAREPSGDGYAGVARLWDTSKNDKPLVGTLSGLPDLVNAKILRTVRPGLSLWRSATGKIQVGLAWEDPSFDKNQIHFRLWDGVNVPSRYKDGYYNNSVAVVPGESRILTTSYRYSGAYHGHLQEWTLGSPFADNAKKFWKTPALHKIQSLGVLARAGKKYGAVVVRDDSQMTSLRYYLRIVDLAGYATQMEKPVELWKGKPSQPVLAVSPTGAHLAVAGNTSNTIRVYSTAALLDGKKTDADTPQILGSEGAPKLFVAFAKKGEARGFLLSEKLGHELGKPRAPKEETDFAFDLKNREVTSSIKGWDVDAPKMGEWRVSRKGGTFTVTNGDVKVGTVTLDDNQDPTNGDYELLPAQGARPALLAVGFRENDETKLALYDVKSGDQFRLLAGHVSTIRDLAFSGDGNLLVSVGDDQIVNVWGVRQKSVESVLGKNGQLPGVSVEEAKDGKGVRIVEVGKAYQGLLRKGTIVSAVGDEATNSPHEWYRAIWKYPPTSVSKKKAILRIGRNRVPVAVGQGIDQQPPLFSLFITAGGESRKRRWIGWNAMGSYDFSGDRIEDFIGWHTNTGNTEKPVDFVDVDAQRKKNRKKGILNMFVTHANAGSAIQQWDNERRAARLDRFEFDVLSGEIPMEEREDGVHLVEEKAVRLSVRLGDDYRPELVKEVTWSSGESKGTMTFRGDRWEGDLSGLEWKRGARHKVALRLTTIGRFSKELRDDAMIEFRPVAPTVVVEEEIPTPTMQKQHALKFLVSPAAGQPARVRVWLGDTGKKPLLDKKGVVGVEEFSVPVSLEPGENRLRILVENQEAPDDTRKRESDSWSRAIGYRVPKAQIVLERATPEGGESVDLAKVDLGEPIVVGTTSVRLHGRVASLGSALVKAEWGVGSDKPTALDEFDSTKKPQTTVIDQVVKGLEPGKVTAVQFSSASVGQAEATTRTVKLVYRPELPNISIRNFVDDQTLFWDETKNTVSVKVGLSWPTKLENRASVVVKANGEMVAEKPVTHKMEEFDVGVTLRAGANEIVVEASNSWQTEPTRARVVVNYSRPPRLGELVAGKPEHNPPRGSIRAEVVTAKGMPLLEAVVTSRPKGSASSRENLSEDVIPGENLKKLREEGETDIWLVEYSDVPLGEGTNVVTLRVANADGPNRKPWSVEVEYTSPPKPEPPAEVSFDVPKTDNVTTETAKYRVEFRTESQSKMTSIRVVRGSETLASYSGEALADLQKFDGARHVAHVVAEVGLLEGSNIINVVVENAGPRKTTPAKILQYVPMPVVRLDIQRIEGRGFQRAADGRLLEGSVVNFGAVPDSEVEVVGRLTWNAKASSLVESLRTLTVTINGKQQIPVQLRGAFDSGRFEFRSRLTLTEPDSLIQFRLRKSDDRLSVEKRSWFQCSVECDKPAKIRRQKAHVLIVALGDHDRNKVEADALKALGVTARDGNKLDLPYCQEKGELYGTLVGRDVKRGTVLGQLIRIQRKMSERARGNAIHDVVMIYYQGKERSKGRSNFLETDKSLLQSNPNSSAIRYESFTRILGETPGAHFLWLDVWRESGKGQAGPVVVRLDEPFEYLASPDMAMFRYTWDDDPAKRKPNTTLLSKLEQNIAKAKDLNALRGSLVQGFAPTDPSERLWRSTALEPLFFDGYLPQPLKAFPLTGRRMAP